ncbi:MAG: tetratricopeptide repeat protein [Candidatus Korobacteraceae bacterium]
MEITSQREMSASVTVQHGSAARKLGAMVCCAAILLLSMAGCVRDPKVRAENSYNRAEKYLKENKLDAAVIELRRALQLNPHLAKAHFALGTVEMQRNNVLPAFQQFLAATVDDPDNHEAQVMVAELLTRAHNYTEAKRTADLILSRWPDDKTGTLLLAESEIGLQDYKRALTLVNEVLAADPKNVRGLQDLAILQLTQKDLPQAQATLRRAWQLDPKSPQAVGLLSLTYEAQKDPKTAESILQEALAQNPNQIAFLSMLATFYMRNQRYGDAEPLYQKIQAQTNVQAQYRDVLGQFYLHSGRTKDAETEYKRLLQSNDKDWQSWRGLAITYLMENRPDDAINVLDRLLKGNPRDWEAMAMKGRILLDRGQAAESVSLLQQSHKIHPEAPAPAFDLGRAYIAEGKLPEAQAALQDVIKINSKYPGALTLLAAINLQSGRVDQAIQDLDQDQAQGVDRSFLLSQAYAAKGDYRSAESQLQGILGNPGSAQKKVLILQSLASIKLAQKQYAEAAALASNALELSPRLPTALYVLGISYVDQKQPDKALEVVKARAGKTPDWAQGYQVLGQVAQQAGRLPVAIDAFNQALRIDPKLTSAALSLADTYFLNKQLELARQQYEKVAQEKSARSYAMARLGQIYEAQGNFENAHLSYEKALAADPDNVLAKNNLAWVYAEHGGNIDMALKLAEEAKEKAPEDANVADTLGWIYVKKGSYEAAVANLKSSVEKNPHDPSGLYHLGTAYYMLGRTADARRELEAALKMPDFAQAADAKRMLAQMTSK